jgi:hypothetical protein
MDNNEVKSKTNQPTSLKELLDQVTNSNLDNIKKTISGKSLEEIAEYINSREGENAKLKALDDIASSLYPRIKKLVVLEGILPTDPMTCELYIDDKILRIPHNKLDKSKIFKDEYFRAFKKLIFIKDVQWSALLNLVVETKSEVVEFSEESEFVMIAREIWSYICEMEISEDVKMFTSSGKSIIRYKNDHVDGYFIRSDRIKMIVDNKSFKIRLSDLSQVMKELGMKNPGSPKVGGKRCWQLNETELIKERSLKSLPQKRGL